MKRSTPLLAANPVWQQLTEHEDIATAALFRELCSSSPALRDWLWNEFARDPKVRSSFAKVLKDQTAGRTWDAAFAGRGDAWRVEQDRLRELMPEADRAYGGLTRIEVEQLIRHYQSAGTVDLGAFLLAQRWGQPQGRTLATVIRATTVFINSVVSSNNTSLLNDFAKALHYLEKFKNKTKRPSTVGYLDWWKLNLSLYILQNPRKAYRMRDLTAHLKSLGLTVGVRHIQRFCALHKIARDTSAGRPRRHSGIV